MMELLQDSLGAAEQGMSAIAMLVVTHTIANVNAVITGFTSGGTAVLGAIFPLVILTLQLFLLLTILKVLQMIWFLLHEARFMFRKPKSYSAPRPGGKRILIVGDSTAYGTGADKPEDSIAGRLGHDFPRTEIINTAINGSVVKEAIGQLRRGGPGKFDLIIVCTGGNDIWHFTKLSSLEQDLTTLLKEAVEKSDHQAILLFYANLGNAPIFPSFIRALLNKRTQQVHEVFSRVSASLQVPLVELYTSEKLHGFFPNPFFKDPERYYSQDRMHPNSEGYRLWYNRMWGEMVAHHFMFIESNQVSISMPDTNTPASEEPPRAD